MPGIIQVFSDYVCPYSYLSMKAVNQAAAATGAEVIWRASQAGQVGWRSDILPLAERLGVEIAVPSTAPDTRKAHLAAAWARGKGALSAYHRRLFEAHFRDGMDIGDEVVLGDLAWQAGLNRRELEEALRSVATAEEVDEDLLIGRTYGIQGVPTLVIGGRLIFGVQDAGTLARAIAEAGKGEYPPGPGTMPGLPIIKVESRGLPE